ncbi:MAG: phenylacetate--CoA ligase family protein [Candidatus Hodarchaeota archaeon]
MVLKSLKQNQLDKTPKLRRTVLNAFEKSQLYQEKYRGYDLSQNFEKKFEKLPLLTRMEYYKGMKPLDFTLLTDGVHNSYIFTSGGTTGDVKLTAWSQNFAQNWVDECYRSLLAVGLEEHEVIINLFFPGIWATHTLINKALEKANCRIIPLGGKHSLELLVTYIQTFHVTALIGVPSFIVRLTEFIDALPASQRAEIRIKKIFHAGEFLSPRQAEFIKERLNCQINPFLYSSTDTGTIGMKCPHCGTNQYHLADSMYLEMIDADTGQSVLDEEPGEFVVTSLVNERAPCIRYRVGDMGIMHTNSCPCGNKAPLFTLIGRADDEVKVAGYLISPEIVQQGLEEFSELSRNFQLIVREEGQKTKLIIACETVPSIQMEDTTNLQEKITARLIEHYDILGVLIKQEYCLPLEVQLLPPGAIPRNPRTGKIKRVRNLR